MRIFTGQRGLAGLILVVVIAWALAAVLMLTGTLVAAHTIRRQVVVISHVTSKIDHNLRAVTLAGTTATIASRIYRRATPLSGQLARVVVEANQINTTAGSILRHAGSINNRALSINTNARAINANARAINANARAINANVHLIAGNVGSIDTRVGSINARVGSINARATSIGARVGGINASVGSIDRSVRSTRGTVGLISANLRATLAIAPLIRVDVAGINQRAVPLTFIVAPIFQDLSGTLFQVGPGHTDSTGHATLHGHANSIDCSPLIQTSRTATGAAGSSYCGM